MYAYDEMYLYKARMTLACIFDYAVNLYHIDIASFYDMFIKSRYADLFAMGDSSTVAGKSGVELVYEIIHQYDESTQLLVPSYTGERSPEYWLGYYLAYYQWYRNISFSRIIESIDISDMLLMYNKYHEMDVMAFVDRLDELQHMKNQMARLKAYRLRLGMSQKMLSDISGVPLRTLQQYEQKQKDIRHAKAEYVINLAKALYCRPEDII